MQAPFDKAAGLQIDAGLGKPVHQFWQLVGVDAGHVLFGWPLKDLAYPRARVGIDQTRVDGEGHDLVHPLGETTHGFEFTSSGDGLDDLDGSLSLDLHNRHSANLGEQIHFERTPEILGIGRGDGRTLNIKPALGDGFKGVLAL